MSDPQRRVSPAGRAQITLREGKRNAAYRDSQGVWTIGVGHTGRMAPPPVQAGMYITDAVIDAYLAADLAPVEAAIDAVLRVPVTQNQFDAMASLWFNAGIGYVATSNIIKRLNAGDKAGAAAGFDAYHTPPEIIGRRNGEKAQFLMPDTPAPAGPPPISAPTPPPIPAAKPASTSFTGWVKSLFTR